MKNDKPPLVVFFLPCRRDANRNQAVRSGIVARLRHAHDTQV
ncbi:hypothetical protein [Xanthomonas hawaiiensis]|nr:hypothetical protein [Xanthomonas sp. A6251]WNH43260.1 hypothetical protein PG878_11975 [Xanthomonas sp. A6251]